jgi:hypothetical protein
MIEGLEVIARGTRDRLVVISATVEGTRTLISDDLGVSWHQPDLAPDRHFRAAIVRSLNGAELIEAGTGGSPATVSMFYCSSDGAATWRTC